jgi:hypothetical protein
MKLQVSPYAGIRLAEWMTDRLSRGLPIPVSVTAVNVAAGPNTHFRRPDG